MGGLVMGNPYDETVFLSHAGLYLPRPNSDKYVDMASYHDWGNLFNMDISGGFPYLCASALVYADPGTIRFFPAKPEQWKSGSLKGVRLRGGIVVKELTWNGVKS